MTEIEYIKALPSVAAKLWGPPDSLLSSRNTLRFGTDGMKWVSTRTATWYDASSKQGGGLVDLLLAQGVCDPGAWLRANGFEKGSEIDGAAQPGLFDTQEDVERPAHVEDAGGLIAGVAP